MSTRHDRVATYLLDFAAQRGVLGADAAATLRGTGDAAAVADALKAQPGIDPALIDRLHDEAMAAAQPPAIPGYRITGRIGRGANGVVWSAEQEATGRAVALKLVRAGRIEDGERFLREVALSSGVAHPHVVALIDAAQHGEWFALAMQRVDGPDTAAYARSCGGRIDARTALKIGRDAAAGLAAIHAAGLVHRDIKPANLLLTKDGRTLVADLGLARGMSAGGTLTLSGELVGTPAFMAPEQAAGASTVDARADIYALGATLFALLCGRPPFTGQGLAVLAQAANDPFPDPVQVQPDLPADLALVIRTACARDPARRHASAARLGDDLQDVLDGRPPRHATQRAPERPAAGGSGWATLLLIAAAAGTGVGLLLAPAGPDPAITRLRAAHDVAAWEDWLAEHPGSPHAAEAAEAIRLLRRIAEVEAAARR